MGENLQASLKKITGKFDQLPRKLRALSIVVAMACVYGLSYVLVYAPHRAINETLSDELLVKQAGAKKAEGELYELKKQGPDAIVLRKQQDLDELQNQLVMLTSAIDKRMKALVSPRDMLLMVHEILQDQARIEIQSIENLSAEALNTDPESVKTKQEKESKPKDQAPSGQVTKDEPKPVEKQDAEMLAAAKREKQSLYRHGLRVTVRGRYPDLVSYLVRLEKLEWQIFWGDVKLVVDKYPYSTVTVNLYTLSPQPGWLGV